MVAGGFWLRRTRVVHDGVGRMTIGTWIVCLLSMLEAEIAMPQADRGDEGKVTLTGMVQSLV